MPGRSVKELGVKLTADVTDFVRGTQDAAGESRDLAADVERDADRLARAYDDAARDVSRSFDRMHRDADSSFRGMGDSAEHAGRDTKAAMGEAGSEVGAEFAQNMGEAVASGDFSEVAASTGGGLVSAFAAIGGPVGIIAGIGTGLATALYTGYKKKAEQEATRITNMTATMFEKMTSDVQAALQDTVRGAGFQTLMEELGEGNMGRGMQKLRDLARQAKVPFSDLVTALTNGGGQAQAMLAKLGQIRDTSKTTSVYAKGQQQQMSAQAKSAQTLYGYLSGSEDAMAGLRDQSRLAYEALVAQLAPTAQIERNLERAARHANTIANTKTGPAGTVVGGRARL